MSVRAAGAVGSICLAAGFAAGLAARSLFSSWGSGPAPPAVAGQPVPAGPVVVDLAKPHDFHFKPDQGCADTVTFRGCSVAGSVTELQEVYGLSSSAGGGRAKTWLVLARPGGSRAYLPAESLLYFEESPAGEGKGGQP